MAECHVAIAREWLGTPYRHQASVKGVGCDCLGLVRGVWHEILGSEPQVPPAYNPDWGEYGTEEILWNAATRHLTPVHADTDAVGDVLLFRMKPKAIAKHVAISVGNGSNKMIHAISNRAVCETTITLEWRRRLVAQFAFPNRRL